MAETADRVAQIGLPGQIPDVNYLWLAALFILRYIFYA
jgi:hypothetical protein